MASHLYKANCSGGRVKRTIFVGCRSRHPFKNPCYPGGAITLYYRKENIVIIRAQGWGIDSEANRKGVKKSE